MGSRFFYSAVRIVALSVAAAAGYVSVYIPLMNMFFRKGPEFFLILGLSIAAAFKCAKFADRQLPRPVAPDTGREAGG